MARYLVFTSGIRGIAAESAINIYTSALVFRVGMSSCQGDLAVTAKVDREMVEFADAEAERLGVNRSEFLRRLLELYRDSRREQVDCAHCGNTVKMDLRT